MHSSLAGRWDFRFDDETTWRSIEVPGCWEMLDGVPKDRSGPAWYRTTLAIPEGTGQRYWLEFDAVSYDTLVLVNGRDVGRHLGLWDAFRLEITDAVQPGKSAELLVRVEKPASLTRGPKSAVVEGSYPTPETLAGFLPYVWGHIFGGIWQDVRLVSTGNASLRDIHVRASGAGALTVEAGLTEPARVRLQVLDPDGAEVYTAAEAGQETVSFATTLAAPRPWSPSAPALYQARLSIDNGDEQVIRFGLRSVRAVGSTLLLNDAPLYPRMALSWGWYPEALHSNPGRERVRRDFARLRELGYNGVKLCLWFPPSYYFELADELGMLLWVEFPMWLPHTTAFFQQQTLVEYERLARQARNHPSVVLYTLGCELNNEVGADLLERLFRLVKPLVGDALVRDNSGSGEAYGGLLNEFAEYYDYHFYTDIQFMRTLLDFFSPRWRPEMPWLFGEFCDLDTFRDLRRVYDANGGDRPWWTVRDAVRNPQGARWQFDIVDIEQRLGDNGFWERSAELQRISGRQALLHRKWTLEFVRSYREISGYVVTGEVDTPISTAGMWDDLGEWKWDPGAFRSANDDLVVLVGWDKRRAWIDGGDRAAPWDTWSYIAGSTVRAHLVISHYGRSENRAEVEWAVAFGEETAFASGTDTSPTQIQPGAVREITIAEFAVPDVGVPRSARLRTEVRIGDETTTNSWPLWVFPANSWADICGVALIDPTGRLQDFSRSTPHVLSTLDGASVAIATAWTSEVAAFVDEGGDAILLQGKDAADGPFPTVAMPFWREAVKLIERHGAWRDFPHDGWVDLQFFGCATDYALDLTGVAAVPILRRVDARTMAIHDYAAEVAWGKGRLIVSTLRFEGGLGEQPLGLSRNTAAAYLLSCWTHWLAHHGKEP